MYRYVLKGSKNGPEIYVNLITSSAGHYLSRNPYIIKLVKEVVESKKLSGPEVIIEHDMGRVIGNSNVVTTSEKDTIFYAQPYKKDFFSRYVKNRSLSPSKKLTILLNRDTDGDYEIIDTWIGSYTPPFPGDVTATKASATFWQTHAVVMDDQPINSKTVTKICPY